MMMERRKVACGEVGAGFIDSLRRGLTELGELIYFDTIAFDPENGLSEAQLDSIRGDPGNTFRLVFGIDCLEEALLGVDSTDPKKPLEHIRRILRWTDARLVAKPADQLLCDDVVAYSKVQPSSPWLENPRLAWVKKNLLDLRTLDVRQLRRKFAPEIDEIRRRRDRSASRLEQTISELSSDPFVLANRETKFPEFYRLVSLHVAENFARGAEQYVDDRGLLDRCKERGIEGLLDIRSVRLATIVTLRLFHTQFLNEGRQTAKPRGSDLADIRHAVVASSADIFVTNDRRQFTCLSRVDTAGWRVICLKNLIAELHTEEPPGWSTGAGIAAARCSARSEEVASAKRLAN
jgi:hypothetical protein